MARLRTTTVVSSLRARRWDAVVLGSGIPSLVAAARMGMAGLRVLVVEEPAARNSFPGLREPFFLGGARDGGAVDACLRELTLPLIDRRRIVAQRLAYQVIAPQLRLDVGEPTLTADELVAWGVAKPELARSLVRALCDAADAEREEMLGAALVRTGRRISRGRGQAAHSSTRGLPVEAAAPDSKLGPILEAQVRALSNLAGSSPMPEARARLLGASLAGGAGYEDGPPWLAGLLRRRVESVYGEFRTLGGSFELVSVDQHPAIAPHGGTELWVGRALVLGAPLCALTDSIEEGKVPDFVASASPGARRRCVHWRVRAELLPEALAYRAILVGDPSQPLSGANCLTLARYTVPGDPGWVDLVAKSSPCASELEPGEDEIEERVAALLPFAHEGLIRQRVERPKWDDDDWLEDPPRGAGWPGELDLRVSSRPPVYRLARAGVGGLGAEGDLLLGWRAGDAIAGDLA